MTLTEVEDFPWEGKLTPFARKELLNAGGETADVVRKSDKIWTVRAVDGEIILIFGVLRNSIVGEVPELWILLCQPFLRNTRRNLYYAALAHAAPLAEYYALQTQVREDYVVGKRFVEFMGWVETGRMLRADGAWYKVYEVRS